jgi:hypothetical protein
MHDTLTLLFLMYELMGLGMIEFFLIIMIGVSKVKI